MYTLATWRPFQKNTVLKRRPSYRSFVLRYDGNLMINISFLLATFVVRINKIGVSYIISPCKKKETKKKNKKKDNI